MILVQKQLTGEVHFLNGSAVIASLSENATMNLGRKRGVIQIIDELGRAFVLSAQLVSSTQVLPASAVNFSGDVESLWSILIADFFNELHNSQIIINSNKVIMGGVWEIRGVLTPPIFAVDQNNYSPVSFEDNTIIRVSSSANRDITGFAAPGIGEQPIKVIVNVGANNIQIMNQSVLSVAANRIAAGANEQLNPNESAIIWYDQMSARWRILSIYN